MVGPDVTNVDFDFFVTKLDSYSAIAYLPIKTTVTDRFFNAFDCSSILQL